MGGDEARAPAVIDRSYFQPADLKQARSFIAKHQDTKVVAGGTDLVVAARSGKSTLPGSLMAIHNLKELAGIEEGRGGRLKIGALATHGDLEESTVLQRNWTALSDASALVGSPATRHIGTVGGNICNASPAMELGSPLLIFEAEVELAGKGGLRRVPFGSFVVGPGETTARPGELLTAVLLPRLKVRGTAGSAYIRLEYRRAMEIAIVGAAALIAVDRSRRCKEARVGLTAVAPTCVRASDTEEMLRGAVLDSELLNRAAAAATRACSPIDDVRASADYRLAMVQVIVLRAITRALDRALAQSTP
jgi:CO/xanthine dehydrogenase FAD-binding subunit